MDFIDYRFWVALDKWTAREAALLLDAKDPYLHSNFDIRSKGGQPGYEKARLIAAVIKRTNWGRRYGVCKWEVKEDPIYICDAVRHAGFTLPAPLIRELAKRQSREEPRAAPRFGEGDGSKSAATKERQTMLKMIIGLAMGGYRMDPDAHRNLHAKEMRLDLERAGVALDDATIKKYLDEARRLRRSVLDGQRQID
ncbi:hypothetical protein AWB80_01641 [Caballeronia pedi]|uniref:Uncharacterized protein n=1 Tax=Caballeronia pedi TaxID=1777141 RepID=A0A158A0V4_9BURK|nr:hypothetical protein [Caballeronia pedi]SAK51442.1 hypothetical protein AWB80_01641 [Caballeronia pedi]